MSRGEPLWVKLTVAAIGGAFVIVGLALLYGIVLEDARIPFGFYAVLIAVGIGGLLVYTGFNLDSVR